LWHVREKINEDIWLPTHRICVDLLPVLAIGATKAITGPFAGSRVPVHGDDVVAWRQLEQHRENDRLGAKNSNMVNAVYRTSVCTHEGHTGIGCMEYA
jgi:hypothetical protein